MNPELQKRLVALNQLNETKGQELAVLAAIPSFRTDAENSQDWEAVAESYWQEHLAHQHIVMNDNDPEGSRKQAMLSSAQEGLEIVAAHNLDNLLGHAHRFMGRAFTYHGRHSEALDEYRQAQSIFSDRHDSRYLEVSGFIAESLVRAGSVEEGMQVAYHTFEDYDLMEYSDFKNRDYYKWAVWRTGIFPRLVTALQELNIDFDRRRILGYLEKSVNLLTDKSLFAYRIAEVEQVIKKLN